MTRHPTRAPVLAVLLVLLLPAAPRVFGQNPAHPLMPPDRSTPRATLRTFLESTDALLTFARDEYLPAPTRAKFHHLVPLIESNLQNFDLSALAPVSRSRLARSAATALYETLARIELPPWDEVPGSEQLATLRGDPPQWTIPNTEITLVRVRGGPHGDVFLFSTETVARAGEFYRRVQNLPYRRAVPIEGWYQLRAQHAGWLIPHRWIENLPSWLRTTYAGQAAWKWSALALVLLLFLLAMVPVYRLSRGAARERVFLNALVRLMLPVFFLAGALVTSYLAQFQINLVDAVGEVVGVLTTAVLYFAGAWVVWRAASVLAEALVALPHVASQSIDAHMIRLFTRLAGLGVALTLVVSGANQLGIPVYGIIAGLGVGGLAIALAAQPTIENLIGGLNIFADRPIRVGNFCQYGSDLGTVETIGIRSTRIRGLNRTITTIPNAILSKMPIVNFAERDRMLIRCVLNLRYETSRAQLQFLLASLRKMLLEHPRIHPDPARVRFIGFGPSSLDVEVFAYVTTRDWNEFLGIREGVFLRFMEIVERSGTSFAFPSQTLYFGRDAGLDAAKAEAAAAQFDAWQREERLTGVGASSTSAAALSSDGHPPATRPA